MNMTNQNNSCDVRMLERYQEAERIAARIEAMARLMGVDVDSLQSCNIGEG